MCNRRYEACAMQAESAGGTIKGAPVDVVRVEAEVALLDVLLDGRLLLVLRQGEMATQLQAVASKKH